MVLPDETDDSGQMRPLPCGRPDSPIWMAEWAFHQAVIDLLGQHGIWGPLEMVELSGRIELDKRLRGIREQVDRFASRLAARASPDTWSRKGVDADKRLDGLHGGKLGPPAASCAVCNDPVSRRRRMPVDEDGKIRCGMCKHYRNRYGRERSEAANFATRQVAYA
jgi:hypothetical protein